ncbi:MAG TPA: 4-hydroxy-tetrahydrodipicolinate synthase [Acidimicrobiia bacterium]|nr:4-hydroxy-tetrahydrodipicolinate synthase [Acidimicrobiia bacterium]
MASELNLRGVYVAAVTPFGADGAVALGALEGLVEGYLDAGAAGIVALGTTAEAAALDGDEKKAVVDVCARACAGRGAQLIVGAGTNNTAASVAAVRALAGTPALVAALSVVPYYVRPSEAGIVEHFRAVSAASPVPLVVYNIPYRTGRALGSASLLTLASMPNIAGVKQAVGSIDLDTLEVLAGAPRQGFAVLGGDDAYLFPTVLMGGAGTVAASANIATERFVAMIDCGLAGKLEEGRTLSEALLPLVKRLFAEPNPAVIKGVLHATGQIPTPDLRLPMTAASTAAVDAALAALEKLP